MFQIPYVIRTASGQQTAILLKWWKSFGFIPTCLSVVALIVFLLGYTFPVFIFFLGSGIAMVTLVTRLGRAGLIDRGTVGGTLIASLVGLAQVTQIAASVDSGCHLLGRLVVNVSSRRVAFPFHRRSKINSSGASLIIVPK